jgi:hypothetical protein
MAKFCKLKDKIDSPLVVLDDFIFIICGNLTIQDPAIIPVEIILDSNNFTQTLSSISNDRIERVHLKPRRGSRRENKKSCISLREFADAHIFLWLL